MAIKLAIGGIGGSGTRIVAKVIEDLGYFIGNDLNRPLDNLLFTLFFKRQNVLTLSTDEFEILWELFKRLMSQSSTLSSLELEKLEVLSEKNRLGHEKKWLKDRVEKIKNYEAYPHNKWAWKEPNTHIVIDKILEKEENLKFIYVYRNGLDMAHSSNQNQLKLWGPIFFNDFNLEISAHNSLKYWCLTHQRMLRLKEKYPHRVLLLEFESLCINPIAKIKEIEEFSESKMKKETLENLLSVITLPSSVNRYQKYSLDEYDKKDIEYVKDIYSNI